MMDRLVAILALAPAASFALLTDKSSDTRLRRAVASRDTAALFNWLLRPFQLQGISDDRAITFAEEHGLPTFRSLGAGAVGASCHRLQTYWHFSDCRYAKTAGICAEPHLMPDCPLPHHPLRNGRLSQGAYSLFLFMRDVCDGDVVGWIDHRLAGADMLGHHDRAKHMRAAVLEPMSHIFGVSNKVLSMVLADLLLAADPDRERWVTTGASMIAIDSLVHNFLHRTGALSRADAEHDYGDGCYKPGGCCDLIEEAARHIDARQFNPAFPAFFPRFIQHSIWWFCAQDGLNICNGNRINDRHRCDQQFCPNFTRCDRLSLHG